MNTPSRRLPRSPAARVLAVLAVFVVLKLAAAACSAGSPPRHGFPGHGFEGRGSLGQPGVAPWMHRSSHGGGDVSVGGDGNGFHYYIDSSGSSWTGG